MECLLFSFRSSASGGSFMLDRRDAGLFHCCDVFTDCLYFPILAPFSMCSGETSQIAYNATRLLKEVSCHWNFNREQFRTVSAWKASTVVIPNSKPISMEEQVSLRIESGESAFHWRERGRATDREYRLSSALIASPCNMSQLHTPF
jgi:hypothetical protein